MKHMIYALFAALVLASSLSAQTIRKVWQTQFDFGVGGNQDDAGDVLVDPEGSYIVTGNTILVTTSGLTTRAASARVTKDGNVPWKWASADDTSWTGLTAVATCLQGTNFFVAQGSQRNPAKLLTFSLDGKVINSRTFGEEKNLAIATNGTMGAAVGYGSPVNAYLFDAAGDSINSFVASSYIAGFHATLTPQHLGLFGNDYTSHGFYNTAAFAKVFDLQGNLLWDKHYDDAIKTAGTIDGEHVYLGYTAFTKVGNDQFYSQIFTTVKYDSDGNVKWTRTWDGDPTSGTRLVSWTEDLINYPGGGCILLGSIPKNGNTPNANLTDFGAIAYDGDGNVRWKLRFEAHDGWERNDLKAAAWDKDGYLILVGSAFKKWDVAPDDHRYLVVSKWFVDGVTTVVERKSPETPDGYALHQNYPNPFNPSTTIEFELPTRSSVKLTVMNLLGQTLATLVDEDLPAGVHRIRWDAKQYPSGVYLYSFETSSFRAMKKMLLVK